MTPQAIGPRAESTADWPMASPTARKITALSAAVSGSQTASNARSVAAVSPIPRP